MKNPATIRRSLCEERGVVLAIVLVALVVLSLTGGCSSPITHDRVLRLKKAHEDARRAHVNVRRATTARPGFETLVEDLEKAEDAADAAEGAELDAMDQATAPR